MKVYLVWYSTPYEDDWMYDADHYYGWGMD